MKVQIVLTLMLLLISSTAFSVSYNMGGFEEGDADGDGVADNWYAYETGLTYIQYSTFSHSGTFAEKISLASEQGYAFGQWYEQHSVANILYESTSVQDNVEYDFIFDLYPVGGAIEQLVSEFSYDVGISVEWWDSNNKYHVTDSYNGVVGTDLLFDKWNRITLTALFLDVQRIRVIGGVGFVRENETPGYWETTIYIDTPTIPEPSSMLLLLVAVLPFVRRRK